jgi:hypothetical protein
MDTTKLRVGQEVWMKSGPGYGTQGKVVKITEHFIEVDLLRAGGPVGLRYGIRFDANGKACDSRDIYEGNWWGDNGRSVPGTDCGPWEL